MRHRFRKLSEIKSAQEKSQPSTTGIDHELLPSAPSALAAPIDEKANDTLQRAHLWLNDVFTSHVKLFKREHYMRMFRSGIEKEMAGAKQQWTSMEKLYMALTDSATQDPVQRLQMTIAMIAELSFAEQLTEVSKLAKQRSDSVQRTTTLNQDANDIRSNIVDRTRDIKIDHFACAIPLVALKLRADIVDDNEGCCPICQNSYTDLSTNTLPDLLADYPVRIKYCGHIIGKACLEQWMSTPKIDEAKYPHRTCPLCRVKIEGVSAPPYPQSLKAHIKTNRIAIETLREMAYGWDMEIDECFDTIATCMSEEIACEELLVVIKNMEGKTRWGYENDEKMLKDKLGKLKEERWVWGFGGDRVWRHVRDEWMQSGTVRTG
jgi:hypothetical protein